MDGEHKSGGIGPERSAIGFSGLFLAVAILAILLLCALWLKFIFFGLFCAYLFLPLERLIERYVFLSKPVKRFVFAVRRILLPIRRFKHKLSVLGLPKGLFGRKKPRLQQNRETLSFCASVTTVLVLLVAVVMFFYFLTAHLVPLATDLGKKVMRHDQENKIAVSVRQHAADLLSSSLQLEEKYQYSRLSPEDQHKIMIRAGKEKLQEIFQDHGMEFAGAMFSRTSSFISTVLKLGALLGSFLTDGILFLFFFCFFLQKMALFRLKNEDEAANNQWLMQAMQESVWLPSLSEETKRKASQVVLRIAIMCNAWVRGYFWIILIEFCLYLCLFSIFSIPFAPLLALLSGSTVLLPFLGPVLNISICVVVILVFSENVLVSLIGFGVAYFLVNLILEQLFLYPILVGEAIGLTTMETIVVVLLGATLAGIPGMIFSVPAAGFCKYLLPLFYGAFLEKWKKKA